MRNPDSVAARRRHPFQLKKRRTSWVLAALGGLVVPLSAATAVRRGADRGSGAAAVATRMAPDLEASVYFCCLDGLSAVGGRLMVDSRAGGGTRIEGRVGLVA